MVVTTEFSGADVEVFNEREALDEITGTTEMRLSPCEVAAPIPLDVSRKIWVRLGNVSYRVGLRSFRWKEMLHSCVILNRNRLINYRPSGPRAARPHDAKAKLSTDIFDGFYGRTVFSW